MSDVASDSGVSLQTVSNVINHPERVKPSTRARVLTTIDRLGFTLNANARSLAVGASDTIGLVLLTLNNGLFIDISRGAHREASRRNLKLLLTDSDDDEAMQLEHLRFLDSVRVGGVILTPASDPSKSMQPFIQHGIPVILANYNPHSNEGCAVLVDNEQVGYLAARHLIDLGRKHLALVTGREALQPVQDRRTGFRRAIAEEGGRITSTELHTGEDLRILGGQRVGLQIACMDPTDRPDGIIAVTDLLAMAIIGELSNAGLDVPGDISVMGCDYDSGAWGGAIPLTTVRMMGEETGVEALRLLEDELTNPHHQHRTVLLTPTLEARESTVGRARR